MSSLTTRRRRPCRMLRGGGAAPFSPQPGIGRRCACTVMLLAFAWVGLAATTAMAQRSAVTVDLGVLDTLGPADPTANPGSRVKLHRPTPPAQRPVAAGGGKTASDQAGSQPQAAGKAPPAAPAQQANLAPPALVAPPAPSPTAWPRDWAPMRGSTSSSSPMRAAAVAAMRARHAACRCRERSPRAAISSTMASRSSRSMSGRSATNRNPVPYRIVSISWSRSAKPCVPPVISSPIGL